MIKHRLNKKIIEQAMAEKKIGLFDLARLLGFSPQLTFYAINRGGKSFAPKIAKVLGIDSDSIIISYQCSLRRGVKRQATKSSNGGGYAEKPPLKG